MNIFRALRIYDRISRPSDLPGLYLTFNRNDELVHQTQVLVRGTKELLLADDWQEYKLPNIEFILCKECFRDDEEHRHWGVIKCREKNHTKIWVREVEDESN